MKKKISALIIGLLFLLGFAVYAAQVFFKIPIFNSVAGWWTVFIIVPALLGLFKRGSFIGSLGLLLVGCGLLVRAQGWFGGALADVSLWEMIIAALLLVVGLSIISGVFRRKKDSLPNKSKHSVDKCCGDDSTAVFSDRYIDYNGREFNGIELDGVFGSVTLDLRNAIINSNCDIKADSIFGSVIILTCDHAAFKVFSNTVFGAVKDSSVHSDVVGLPEITVHADAVFGSVELK